MEVVRKVSVDREGSGVAVSVLLSASSAAPNASYVRFPQILTLMARRLGSHFLNLSYLARHNSPDLGPPP